MASETPPCTVSTTIRTRNTPASASIGQLIPPPVTAPRCHAVPPRISASRGRYCGAGGENVGGDAVGGGVGSWEVGASGSGARATLRTGRPQFQQNLASGSSSLPQLLQ